MARATPRHTRSSADAAAERADEIEVKPLPLGLGVRADLHAWYTWLAQPVHASSLGVFRVVFSLCMYLQATHFNYIFEDLSTSKGVYPYPGLGWIRPPPPICCCASTRRRRYSRASGYSPGRRPWCSSSPSRISSCCANPTTITITS